MIDGLKVTLTGVEIRTLLEDRTAEHRALATNWHREAAKSPDDEAQEPQLPQHLCEYEAQRHEWRAQVLSFLKDHLDPTEIYRLGEFDLEYAELLPACPPGVEQNEHQEYPVLPRKERV